MEGYNLDTGKKYIKDIFSSDSFYSIPAYQRPYVWGQEQVYVLLDDICSAMSRDNEKEYFLGCMIWNTKTVENNDIKFLTQDILDGQQRFITLYLIQGVIRDLSSSKKLKSKVQDRMQQEEDQFDQIPERNRILFEIRDDKDFLDKYLIPEGSTNKVDEISIVQSHKNSSISVKNMSRAILDIRQYWKTIEKEDEIEDIQKYMNDFFKYLSSKVLVLYLATPDNLDDAYNLFTVLNSRGLQLQVSDILRAQNLREIQDSEKKRYAEKWSSYEDGIGAPYREFDDFLWALVFIKMKYRSLSNKSLQKAFENMWKSGLLRKGVGTFDYVGKYIEHYQAITDGSIEDSKTGKLFYNLNYVLTSVFGNTYMAPLMYYRECFGEYKIVDFLVKLDNLLSAAWLINKRGGQTRIFILLRKMEEFSKSRSLHETSAEAADRFLASELLNYDYDDENATTKIDIHDLYDLINKENFGSFSGTRVNKLRYLLLKLDIILGDLNNKIYFDRKSSSIEHLMPRTISDTGWDIEESEHQEWLHRLGNLAMINRKKNAAFSNRSYEDKKSKYSNSIETRANTNFIFLTYNRWGIDQVCENHKRIYELLHRYYDGNSLENLLKMKRDLLNK
ncbi:DUF262 domain-containing protein [Lewinella cohaerens]|uniref:DUF262 domain-containing protein n=1 Tax=Lewinella cohaerens TaxID=70995 RepID=UPI000371296C|nr:DUF262 domain-containing protein [Lewinella cohaerens]